MRKSKTARKLAWEGIAVCFTTSKLFFKIYTAILLITAITVELKGQEKIQFITAHSKVVDIREGDHLQKGIWHISPEVNPDTYLAQRAKRGKKITFYTDQDSIGFDVKEGITYRFGIILNKKDTAFTQIRLNESKPLPYIKSCCSGSVDPDTLPFKLSFKNQIIIKGHINESKELDLLFDTGSNGCLIFSNGLKKSKGTNVHFDGTTHIMGMGGEASAPTSSKNSLTLGRMKWHDIKLTYVEKGGVDGLVGYNLFDGRIVEINYDKSVLVIHHRIPAKLKDYVKLPMKWHGDLPFFPATVINKGRQYKEWFSFDTGGSGDLFIDQGMMTKNRWYGTMKKVDEDELKGAGTNKVKTHTYVIPQFIIGRVSLKDMTADVELPSTDANLQWGIAGNDLLKRFNVIIDFGNDYFYFKPNQQLEVIYHHWFMSRLKLGLMLLTGMIVVLVIYFISRYLLSKSKRSKLAKK